MTERPSRISLDRKIANGVALTSFALLIGSFFADMATYPNSFPVEGLAMAVGLVGVISSSYYLDKKSK